ncbi:MAG: hypothetical protein ACRD50_08590 [Candidatus Acidiferrales bacterium]
MKTIWSMKRGLGAGLFTAAVICLLAAIPEVLADFDNGKAPDEYNEGFEKGGLFFDDGVGVLHIRQSKSTAETDYAPGIAAASGDAYARLLVQPVNNINNDQFIGTCAPGVLNANNFSCGGPFTEWGLPFGGFDGNFDTGIPLDKDGVQTSIDIYLDTAFAATAETGGKDFRFDWDSDLLDSQGVFLQDYLFNMATGLATDSCAPASGGFFVAEASTNSQRTGANAHNPTPPNPPQVCISSSGWYRFTHIFRKDKSGNLEVDMTIEAIPGNTVVGSWQLHPTCMGTQVTESLCANGAPLPFAAAGFNFLGWFPDQEINDLAIDNVKRTH